MCGLTTYKFIKTTENLGKGLSFCKHLFKYRKQRLNHDTMQRRSFLKLQCEESVCSLVFFERCQGLHRVMVIDTCTPVNGLKP